LWLHSLKVAQLLRGAACLHTNHSRSYLNHLVITKVPVPIKRATVSLINVKAYNALFCTLLFGNRCFLKSVLTFEDLISDTYHQDSLYLRVQGCKDPWLFLEAKKRPRADNFGDLNSGSKILSMIFQIGGVLYPPPALLFPFSCP